VPLAPVGNDGSFATNDATPTITCPARPELALCVRFEGAVVDESPNRLALATQAVSFTSSPNNGQAADIGSTSLIKLPDNPLFDLSAVTVEAWVYPRVLDRRMGVVDYDKQYGLIVLPAGDVVCIGSGGGSAVHGGPIRTDTWTSLACAIDGTSISLWIDGLKVSSAVRTVPLHTSSTDGITLGSDGVDGNPFDGLLDNVRIWKGLRSAADICAGSLRCP
jgi:hypothetical protein